MDNFLFEHFNHANSFVVGNQSDVNTRVKNLLANVAVAGIIDNNESFLLSFSTMRKGKPTQGITYSINKAYLTNEQCLDLDALMAIRKD